MPNDQQIVLEQRGKQRQGQHIKQGDGHQPALDQPLVRHDIAQPLGVPSARQGGHAQVKDQPGGEQQVQPIAVDEGSDKNKQGQHQNAAIQQAGFALKLLDRGLQVYGFPVQGRDARRPDGVGAAQHSIAADLWPQAQGKA